MVRVCNICLEKLVKADDDDEDDRRSVASSTLSFPAHQFGSDAVTTMHHGRHSQSPFATAQLFGRAEEPFNLYSIAETRRASGGFDHPLSNSRAGSPGEADSDEATGYLPVRDAPAPFRRNLATDDDKEQVTPAFVGQDTSPARASAPGSKTPIEFPVTVPVNVTPTMSTITFPVSSPDPLGLESPRPHSAMRSRYNSFGGDLDITTTPLMRSRAQSRLEDFPIVQAGWRTRRESTAYAQELNMTSMSHLRIMLHQMLTKEDIPNVKEWEDTLLRLAMSISQKLTFTAHPHRQGEDMDVRRYVKIKKIPGGRPSDSEYVDGAVITKNVAHKDMTRLQRNPRVMFITFPLEFSRVQGQYLHFKQIVMQEKEYLRNLSARIASLRPHVILVEKSVSRIALEELAKHNIAVARGVKPSAIKFVSRMTQGSVTTSIDKLVTSETRLGYCTKFRLQTFDHVLIPGRRKTYMRFEGCSPEMGCTLILRGADIVTLRKIKRVTRFLSFIVRNLKLETHLWKDLVITVHSLNSEAVPASLSDQCRTPNVGTLLLSDATVVDSPQKQESLLLEPEVRSHTTRRHGNGSSQLENEEDLPDEDLEQLRLTKRIQQSLEPYTKTFISASATLRFPPPYPIRMMKKLDDELIAAKQDWEDEVIRREERSHPKQKQQELDPEATPLIQVGSSDAELLDHDSINAQIEALPSPDIPKTPTMNKTPLAVPAVSTPTSRPDIMGYFDFKPPESRMSMQVDNAVPGMTSIASALASPSILPLEPTMRLKTVDDIRLESRLSHIKLKHEEQRRIWEWYLRKNPDDFVLEKYQNISIWRYIVPTAEIDTRRACFPPQMHYAYFYGDNDWT
jgi:1-phosphatidylinositol-3-phosphate 5-kinase